MTAYHKETDRPVIGFDMGGMYKLVTSLFYILERYQFFFSILPPFLSTFDMDKLGKIQTCPRHTNVCKLSQLSGAKSSLA